MSAFRIAPISECGQREPRKRDRNHLAFLHILPCIICGRSPIEAAHVRFASPEHGKRETGKQEKSSDCWTLPLCPHHHRDQHAHGEQEWWNYMGIDPIAACTELYAVSGDDVEGLKVILKHRMGL